MLVRSSVLVAAEVFVSGVPTVLPLTEPLGVDVDVSVPVDFPLALAEPFAAFSANRFCFDAEGAMVGLILWLGSRIKKIAGCTSVSRHLSHILSYFVRLSSSYA
jgi:hypothetical protein